MARARTINFEFPIRGKVTATAYRRQPAGTTPDCLNVIPYSIDGQGVQARGRGGTRWGVARLFPNGEPIGGGTDIQLIRQTTIPLSASLIEPDVQIFGDPFAYEAGRLYTVSGGDYEMRGSSSGTDLLGGNLIDSGVISPNGMDVTADQRVINAGTSASTARWVGSSLALGAAYVLRIRYRGSSAGGSAGVIALIARWNPSAAAGQRGVGATIDLGNNAVYLYSDTAIIDSETFPDGTFDAADERVFELQVNGNTFTVMVDGVTYLTANNITAGAANTGVGFGISIGGAPSGYVDQFQVFAGRAAVSARQTNLVVVEGGSIYQGAMDEQPALVSGGTAVLRQGYKPSMATFQDKAFFVDGQETKPRLLNLTTRAMATFTETAGAVPQKCWLATVWRGRLVLGREDGAEQNFYMSKVGDPFGWDFNEQTSIRAIAGNASATFGRLGQPLVAMATWTDDQLVMFCDHSIYVMSGDPAAGGTLDLLSGSIGCIGPDAWCYAPDGTIFFVAPGGLYMLPGGGGRPVPLSQDKQNDWFAAIDRGLEWVMCAYDVDNYQIHIYRTNIDRGKFVDHMIFDVRTKGFFPIRYASMSIGPASMTVYDGDAPADRTILYGGRNGRIYKVDRAAFSDDGEEVYSYAICGPIRLLDDLTEGKVHAIDFYTGHDIDGLPYNLNWILKLGADHAQVSSPEGGTAPVEITGNASLRGHNPKQRVRGRGGSCSLVLWNNTAGATWALERAVLEVHPAGRQR